MTGSTIPSALADDWVDYIYLVHRLMTKTSMPIDDWVVGAYLAHWLMTGSTMPSTLADDWVDYA